MCVIQGQRHLGLRLIIYNLHTFIQFCKFIQHTSLFCLYKCAHLGSLTLLNYGKCMLLPSVYATMSAFYIHHSEAIQVIIHVTIFNVYHKVYHETLEHTSLECKLEMQMVWSQRKLCGTL